MRYSFAFATFAGCFLGFTLPANADSFNLTVDHRTEIIEAYSVDDQGTEGRTGLRQYPRLRGGFDYQSPAFNDDFVLSMATEHDVQINDFEAQNLDWLPRSLYADLTWRDAYRLRLGLVTSQWGLGLVANNGLTDRQEQTDLFSDPRSGDRMLRSMVLVPVPALNSAFFVAGDYLTSIVTGEDSSPIVLGDDILLPGDTAQQIIAAWQARFLPQLDGGLYFVQRWQESSEGGQLAIRVVDLYLNSKTQLNDEWFLRVQSETALVSGTTDLGSTPTHPEHDVFQIGSALRITAATARMGVALDGLWATGDQNFDDKTLNAFNTDVNFNQGFLLHDRLLTDVTGQAPTTASNPVLTGVPAEDLDRLPSRGSITNTKSLYPKFWFKPVAGLKVYTAALFAWTDVAFADPFQTKMAGGIPTNAYGGSAGDWLGLELDFGLQNHFKVSDAFGFDLGIEGAWLQPGDALRRTTGENLNSIMGARAFISFQL